MRLPLRTGLPVVAGLIAGGLAVGAAPTGPAVASGQVCEGIVVDEGIGTAPVPQTANVAPGASDLDALNAAGDSFAQNGSGLVCGIDAYPPNALENCLGTANGLYYYWSYWEGNPATDTWTYAQAGPAQHTVAAGQTYVEGWRYQDPGPDGPSATKPSVSPAAAFAAACPGVTPASTAGGGGSGSGGGGSAGGSTQGGAATTTPGPVTTPTASSAPPPGAGAQTPGSASGVPRPAPAGSSRSAGGVGAATPTTTGVSGATSTTTTTAATPAPAIKRTTGAKLALASAAQRGAGGDPALPVIVVAVLIALIGGAAWYRWRRRPVEE